MSDITPLSYIDDGLSFSRRLPPITSRTTVSRWLNSTSSDTTSAYTGSCIDDGLDLLPPTAPGFGQVNPRFYKHKKRQDSSAQGAWNDDIARAVGGDISRSLAHARNLAHIDIRKAVRSREEENKRRGVVSVPAPLKWGTFVIKGEDGRVVVIDESGEFDSGPVEAVQEVVEDRKDGEGKRWVKAVSSVDTPPPTRHSSEHKTGSTRKTTFTSRLRSKPKSDTSPRRNPIPRPKPLTPVPESVSSYSDDDIVKISPLASPTNFFMTGGLSGWPSRAPSPGPPTPVVPHAITCDTTSPPRTSHIRSKSKSGSTVHSPPDGWPSPPILPARDESRSTHPEDHGSRRLKSKQSSRRRREEEEIGMASAKTYSTYKAPDIVEVIYDETPPGEVSHSQAGWGVEKAASTQSWDDAYEIDKAKGWSGSHKGNIVKSFEHASVVSDLGWGGSAKSSSWRDSHGGSKAGSLHGWEDEETQSRYADDNHDAWDGFERPKTASEVSVAGSGSERSWPASQHSQHTPLSHNTHRSNRSHLSHASYKSSRHSQSGWGNSQPINEAASSVHWNGSDAQSTKSCSKSKHGSQKSWAGSSPTKYQNGFDEDNETYLNETWGGIPVRVASRRTSVVGGN